MRRLAILGAGGHGQVVAETAISLGWEELYFFDDAHPVAGCYGSTKGTVSDYLRQVDLCDGALVAIGNIEIRERIQKHLVVAGANLVSLVSQFANVSPTVKIGAGCLVLPSAILASGVTLGDGVIINHGAVVDHDCTVGDFTHICPRVAIGGDSTIESRCWVGIGSTVINGITIGTGAYLGAGAVLVRDLEPETVAYGVPAKVKSPQSA